MAKFVIEGGNPLFGKIKVAGAKNAALKMLAACILTEEICELKNVPEISDIFTMIKLLEDLGASVQRVASHHFKIDPSKIRSFHPDDQLVGFFRGSVVLIGPLLSRFGQVKIAHPGGCLIGTRPIDTHLKALKKLGVEIKQEKGHYFLKSRKLKGTKIILDEMSFTATENTMMATSLASGTSQIRLAASEPEVKDLALFLNKMGAKIEGAGTHEITIKGVSHLKGVSHQVIPDRIEAGTWAILAAITKGEMEIENVIADHLDAFLNKLEEANVNWKIKNKSLLVKSKAVFHPLYIDTRPYPGFPTDLQAPFALLLTQAKGTSCIFETLYEGRLSYVKELNKMGASCSIKDPHTVIIKGPTPLYGKRIESYDLRAGATLILASLIAQGESVIDKIELVDRGYEKIDERLRNLGAKIRRIR